MQSNRSTFARSLLHQTTPEKCLEMTLSPFLHSGTLPSLHFGAIQWGVCIQRQRGPSITFLRIPALAITHTCSDVEVLSGHSISFKQLSGSFKTWNHSPEVFTCVHLFTCGEASRSISDAFLTLLTLLFRKVPDLGPYEPDKHEFHHC